ncbi:restriction endonuclease subunit S [uncultured Sulfitobacter sp.]|uniref:restriction endonuclease subunit S n=1 Tax=uncultured Sulfitobacter sp. TaxID=191468 RepID=UPI002639EE41|nr:restriction endonuclease subunit S [uncultured Sulfitobacter sp.]
MSYSIKNITLGEACEIRAGYAARTALTEDAEKGVPAIQLRDLHGEQVSLGVAGKYALDGKLDRYLVKPGDVLFRSRGENNTASIAIGNAGETAIALLPVMVIKPKDDDLLPEYIAWSINQYEAQRHLDLTARGTKLRMIPREALEALPLHIPNVAIQRMITELDALSAAETQLLHELADTKRKFTKFALLQQVRNAELHANEARHNDAQDSLKSTGKSQQTKP